MDEMHKHMIYPSYGRLSLIRHNKHQMDMEKGIFYDFMVVAENVKELKLQEI